MTIGWGTLGILWNKTVFTAFVRETRHTKKLLEYNPEFTINVPINKPNNKLINFCGSNSIRDVDKIKEASLTLVNSDIISVPGIKEYPLTLECKVVYVEKQNLDELSPDIINRFYPTFIKDASCGCNSSPHIAFVGEIVNTYIIE